MNYIKKTVFLFLASISFLSATSTDNMSTKEKVNRIYEHFDSMTTNYELMEGESTKQLTEVLENNITIFKDQIINLINSDKNIINQTNNKGKNETFLIRAAASNQIDIIDILLKKGANVNATDLYEQTPLMVAAMKDAHVAMALLLKHGADITRINNKGKTVLGMVDTHLDANKTATKKTIRLLKTALMYLYITRAALFLFGVLLVLWLESIGWGINFYLSELTQIRD